MRADGDVGKLLWVNNANARREKDEAVLLPACESATTAAWLFASRKFSAEQGKK